jgi:uroporphyrinogen-III synthase
MGDSRCLVRPAAQAPATAKLFRHRGAAPVTIPLVSIEDPADPAAVRLAARSLGTYDWVLLTSANGAERLLVALEAEKLDA